jgi:hypothetical protein
MKDEIFTDQIGEEVYDDSESKYIIYEGSDKYVISDLIYYKKKEEGSDKDFGCYPCNKLIHYNDFENDSDYYKIGFGSDMFFCGGEYMAVPNFIAGNKNFLGDTQEIENKLGSTNKDYQPSIYFSVGHDDIQLNHQLLKVSSFTSYKKNENTQIKVGKNPERLFEEQVHKDGRSMHELEINVIDAPVIDNNNRIPFWDEGTLRSEEGYYYDRGRLAPSRTYGKNFLGIPNDNDLVEAFSDFLVSMAIFVTPYNARNKGYESRWGLSTYLRAKCDKYLCGYHRSQNDPPYLSPFTRSIIKNPDTEDSSIFDHYHHDQGDDKRDPVTNLSWAEIKPINPENSSDAFGHFVQSLGRSFGTDDVLKFHGTNANSMNIYNQLRIAESLLSYFLFDTRSYYIPLFHLQSPEDQNNKTHDQFPERNLLQINAFSRSDFAQSNGKQKSRELISLYGLNTLAGGNTKILQNCFPNGIYGTNGLLTFTPITNFRWHSDATSANGTQLFDSTISPPLKSYTPNKLLRYSDSYDEDIISYVLATEDAINFTVEI